jgi:1,4-dihydroxy-2-naphthoate octaprenyltransferase
MWWKAATVIPRLDADEWRGLDFVAKWLVSTRFAAVILTLISAGVAGILAYRIVNINVGIWILMIVALVFAHASNNLINDIVDYTKGVDRGNYYRAQYGPQPLEHGFMTRRGMILYAGINFAIAAAAGAALVDYRGGLTLLLMILGIVFLGFYTYPFKYYGLGEVSVFIVWGPLMIGGGYYVLTGVWDWQIILAGLPFAIGATLVIFGKHIDKVEMDREKRVHTLPVIIGERAARKAAIGLVALQYAAVIWLVAAGYFTPVVLIVLISLPLFFRSMLPMFSRPKPGQRPEDYPADAWPLWFVGSAFVYTRRFGLLYLSGLILDTVLRRIFLHS